MSSTFSRVDVLLRNSTIRTVLGQTERVIDFRRIMDDGHIVLANFKPRPGFKENNPVILGRLLVNSLFSTALEREPNTSRPFFLIIDEAYEYLNEDIEKTLDQTRKFGLHAVLAYQRLGQLRAQGESVYDGVMHGCQTKIVFGTTHESAKILADDLLAAHYNLERPKHILDKPVVTGYDVIHLQQRVEGESRTTGKGGAASIAETEGSGEGQNEYYPDPTAVEAGSLAKSTNAQRSTAATLSTSWQDTLSKMKSEGVGEALKPILTMMVTQVHSLEEERHLAAVQIEQLQQQYAFVQLPNKTVRKIKTHDVHRPRVRPERLEEFRQQALARNEFATPVIEVERQIDERWQLLKQYVQEPIPEPAPTPTAAPQPIEAVKNTAPPQETSWEVVAPAVPAPETPTQDTATQVEWR